MHRRISSTLNALRQDLTAKLGSDVIHAACRAAGHTWCASALLTPAAIIHWFLIQVFHGNTALNHVTLMAGRSFTASAFCQARTRLPPAVFRAVLRAVIHALVPDTQARGRWLGLRPFLLDGSSFSMPDTPRSRPTSDSPATRPKAAVSRWPTSWPASTLAPGCCWRSSQRRCGRMTWPVSPGSFPS